MISMRELIERIKLMESDPRSVDPELEEAGPDGAIDAETLRRRDEIAKSNGFWNQKRPSDEMDVVGAPPTRDQAPPMQHDTELVALKRRARHILRANGIDPDIFNR